MNRFRDAIAISDGACNPSGIARAIVEAIDQVKAEGKGRPEDCPAVCLMIHQLAALCRMEDISDRAMTLWGLWRNQCKIISEATSNEKTA